MLGKNRLSMKGKNGKKRNVSYVNETTYREENGLEMAWKTNLLRSYYWKCKNGHA